ncbi:YheC/YheD family protein [Candidatus Pristimantibacillus sp. PTI5]|uniref:YheC/YheD family protein n=1 Tax=Candidatus Pristimantibacillus sp. PTI5 TaxID=3400422 RepID=UPI003B0126BB
MKDWLVRTMISVSKWISYTQMKEEKMLAGYLPVTELFSEKSLFTAIKSHQSVMIKPVLGNFGKGIIQVTVLKEQLYEIHISNRKIVMEGWAKTYRYLIENHIWDEYIVQQNVQLASIDKCLFDVRVMVQRKNLADLWDITGKVAKVAIEGFVITNAAKEVMHVEKAIKLSSLNHLNHKHLIASIDRISLLVANQLAKYHPQKRTFGLDMGIDRYGRVWVIEANFQPLTTPFEELQDFSILQKIKEFRGKKKKVK